MSVRSTASLGRGWAGRSGAGLASHGFLIRRRRIRRLVGRAPHACPAQRRPEPAPHRPRTARRAHRQGRQTPAARFGFRARRLADPRPRLDGSQAGTPGAQEVPAGRRDRPRRHGRDLEGPRHRPRPRRRLEGARSRTGQEPGGGVAVRRRGADRRSAAAPGHRAGVRARADGRPVAVLHDEAGQGAHLVGVAVATQVDRRQPHPPAVDLRLGLPDPRLRAQQGRAAPRRQTGEHHGRRVRRGAGGRLGARQGAAPRWGRRREARQAQQHVHRHRDGAQRAGFFGNRLDDGFGDGHACVHVARTGAGRAREARRTGRRVRARRDAVRDPDRSAAVRGHRRRADADAGRARQTRPGAGPDRRLRRRSAAEEAVSGMPSAGSRRAAARRRGRGPRGARLPVVGRGPRAPGGTRRHLGPHQGRRTTAALPAHPGARGVGAGHGVAGRRWLVVDAERTGPAVGAGARRRRGGVLGVVAGRPGGAGARGPRGGATGADAGGGR